ncbi:MAG: orotidine-5'-phosphate decarboxylase [Coriobacteriaceae bacterium]|nr:orotidine-5'-phosphate decarboxylase [Coriobacteriaceae bacterium]
MPHRIIIALDTDMPTALALAERLHGRARWLKVGMTLFYAEGPSTVARLREMGFDVFLDLKLHDIPHQVAGAASEIARLGVGMVSVHASGGSAMVRAAAEGLAEGAAKAGVACPKLLAVTVLTSMDAAALAEVGVPDPPAEQVLRLAHVARHGGADGVVCSPEEAARMRALLGADALVVTPGVRPAGSDAGDQARVATPRAAVAAGASHLVIGRPITAADNPVAAYERIVAEVSGL